MGFGSPRVLAIAALQYYQIEKVRPAVCLLVVSERCQVGAESIGKVPKIFNCEVSVCVSWVSSIRIFTNLLFDKTLGARAKIMDAVF